MSYVIVILVTAAVCLPAGAYLFYRYGSALKADAKAIGVVRVRDAVKK